MITWRLTHSPPVHTSTAVLLYEVLWGLISSRELQVLLLCEYSYVAGQQYVMLAVRSSTLSNEL